MFEKLRRNGVGCRSTKENDLKANKQLLYNKVKYIGVSDMMTAFEQVRTEEVVSLRYRLAEREKEITRLKAEVERLNRALDHAAEDRKQHQLFMQSDDGR